MGDFSNYRPRVQPWLHALPPSALDTFKVEIEAILRSYGIMLPVPVPWQIRDKGLMQTLEFQYEGRPLHLYASIQHTQLGFGISYLSDFGVHETCTAAPADAGAAAAGCIKRTLERVDAAAAPKKTSTSS